MTITHSVERSSETGSNPSRDRLLALAIALSVFLILLATRSHILNQLPTWDGAMGMTPAALTLAATNFDLFDLLRQPSYEAGGPNTHSLSLATLMTAGVIALTGSYQSALPILHLISFALTGALAAATFFLVVRATADQLLAAIAAGVTILYPPLLVQASDVYLDLPMTAAVVWALHFAFSGRRAMAILMICLAIWIKPTAVIALPALAYLFASDPTSKRGHWSTVASMIPPMTLALGVLMAHGTNTGVPLVNSPLTRLIFLGFRSVWYSIRTPGLLVLVGSAIVALAVGSRAVVRDSPFASPKLRLVLAMSIFFTSTLLFFLLNPLVTIGFAILPRYTIVLAPTLVALIAASVSLRDRRMAIASCIFVGLSLAAFMSGALVSSSPEYYAVSERDLSYAEHLAVQQQAMDHFEELSRLMPVYYDHFTHFRFEYSQMGWTAASAAEGTPVYLTNEGSPTLETMPSQFAVLFEANWLGGEKLEDLWKAATESETHRTEVFEHRSGRYVNYVVVVTRTDRAQPSSG